MKKLALILTLLGAFSSALLADTAAEKTAEAALPVFEEVALSADIGAGKDNMGMMAAFMGVQEVAGGEVSNTAAPSINVATSSTITIITNSNVTTSTPYSYKK